MATQQYELGAGRSNVRVQRVGPARRKIRRPQHTFHLEHRAMQIQPFFIAPVLPGETMKSLLMQVRAVTDPVNNPLIGWWLDHYIFYVKHRDLDTRDAHVEMMLNPSYDDADEDVAATTTYNYTFNGAINWVQLCLNRVVDTFFRDVDEDVANGVLDNLPMVHAQIPGWMDSLIMDSVFTAGAQDVPLVDAATADVLYASELDAAMAQYKLLQAGGLTQQTYEEFLATYGVRVPQEELHRPEILRFSREWQYPSNTIDPTNGTPRSAISWSVQERADKDRFFREPGFIFGVTCARPKIYVTVQKGAAVGMMNTVKSWLPAVLHDAPMTSFKKFTDAVGDGPLQDYLTGDYWIDVKDLLMHGDQFINFATTPSTPDGTRNVVSLPATSGARRYLSDADIDALFVTPATLQRVRQDGVVNLNIATSIQDTSHGVTGLSV